MRFFLFLFIAIPLVEIYVLIAVGQRIGGLPTVALILATAFLGLALLRQQGYKAMVSAQTKMSQGALPAKEMVDGVFLAVGGVLLLTPGFVTDALGFCCLIPGIRQVLVMALVRRAIPAQMRSQAGAQPHSNFQSDLGSHSDAGSQSQPSSQRAGRTIEGQFHRDE